MTISSPYSTIKIYPEDRLLHSTWLEESKQLNEDQVMQEMLQVSRLVVQHQVQLILADVIHYPFRENTTLQNWINNQYIPDILDSGIKRYAIVVKEMVMSNLDNLEGLIDKEDSMELRYFTDSDEAKKWLISQ